MLNHSRLSLADRYDRMIVDEFDLAFPGLRPAPGGGGVWLGEFDLNSLNPPKNRQVNFLSEDKG